MFTIAIYSKYSAGSKVKTAMPNKTYEALLSEEATNNENYVPLPNTLSKTIPQFKVLSNKSEYQFRTF